MATMPTGFHSKSIAAEPQTSTQNPRKQYAEIVQEERSRKIKECVTSDRPKPEVEKEMKIGLCGKAISLPIPTYPPEAKAQKISGPVRIRVVVDEDGNVIWAKGIEGHPLLQEASIRAACQSLFSPEKISGRPIKVSREISYNFLNEQ